MSTMMAAVRTKAEPMPIKEPRTGVKCKGKGDEGGAIDVTGATAFEATGTTNGRVIRYGFVGTEIGRTYRQVQFVFLCPAVD